MDNALLNIYLYSLESAMTINGVCSYSIILQPERKLYKKSLHDTYIEALVLADAIFTQFST